MFSSALRQFYWHNSDAGTPPYVARAASGRCVITQCAKSQFYYRYIDSKVLSSTENDTAGLEGRLGLQLS